MHLYVRRNGKTHSWMLHRRHFHFSSLHLFTHTLSSRTLKANVFCEKASSSLHQFHVTLVFYGLCKQVTSGETDTHDNNVPMTTNPSPQHSCLRDCYWRWAATHSIKWIRQRVDESFSHWKMESGNVSRWEIAIVDLERPVEPPSHMQLVSRHDWGSCLHHDYLLDIDQITRKERQKFRCTWGRWHSMFKHMLGQRDRGTKRKRDRETVRIKHIRSARVCICINMWPSDTVSWDPKKYYFTYQSYSSLYIRISKDSNGATSVPGGCALSSTTAITAWIESTYMSPRPFDRRMLRTASEGIIIWYMKWRCYQCKSRDGEWYHV